MDDNNNNNIETIKSNLEEYLQNKLIEDENNKKQRIDSKKIKRKEREEKKEIIKKVEIETRGKRKLLNKNEINMEKQKLLNDLYTKSLEEKSKLEEMDLLKKLNNQYLKSCTLILYVHNFYCRL